MVKIQPTDIEIKTSEYASITKLSGEFEAMLWEYIARTFKVNDAEVKFKEAYNLRTVTALVALQRYALKSLEQWYIKNKVEELKDINAADTPYNEK
ncbi:MAG: hypothetical protein HQK88_02685 [Nitrospirae bacterium]|nr:hypothetical protein [Nitrospirota bacterium]MBF0534314.1 hypothetical protein [Nitrospirota bacterium]MBF0615705.1 hypothetical protein [Nitrospirota bacterium]